MLHFNHFFYYNIDVGKCRIDVSAYKSAVTAINYSGERSRLSPSLTVLTFELRFSLALRKCRGCGYPLRNLLLCSARLYPLTTGIKKPHALNTSQNARPLCKNKLFRFYLEHLNTNSSHLLSTSFWNSSRRYSFSFLKRCLNLPCGMRKSSIGSFFFGS